MRVFISYGSAYDQVTALRLQALAAVNGLTVYVPPADTRRVAPSSTDPESRQKLTDTDVVLGVIGAAGLSEACRQELSAGMTLQKKTLVLCDPAMEPHLRPSFGANLVVLNPGDPAKSEASIVQHLKAIHAKENERNALLALSTLAMGLLIFAVAVQD